MLLKELMKEAGFSQYRLAVESGVPHATLSGLLTGKTKIERCESGTLYKLTKTLGVSMEILVEDGIRRTEREKSYGLKTHSNLLDCYWGELYGSINSAEIDDGAITAEHANYLRNKFLWGKEV